MNSFDILLSTYNGEKYLTEQIESLYIQNNSNWHLLVRDDGSEDSTVAAINAFAKSHPERITIVGNNEGNLGPVQSYLNLMKKSSAPYIAFCDQDDVWGPNKLSKQLSVLRDAEDEYGEQVPILVHSNSRIVDSNLNILSSSQWEYQKTNPDKMTIFNRLLIQNCITGCATIINRQLLELALSVKNPENIIMHDWWLGLIAAAKGKIISMPEPLLFYRQHSANDTGSRKWGLSNTMSVLKNSPADLRARLIATKVQAEELLNVGILNSNEEIIVKHFVEAFDLNWFRKRMALARGGYLKYGFIRNLAMFLII